ncbi:MAG TPA: YdbL family protein [Steroidobacteraceae bacterium]|nr:YdbL family protein [Steroidobacteraceae bacterium]HRX88172.1 YdbL family protein [Steroidobacteraceae bacterium]
MRRVLPFNLALASVFLAACVTINVYFPAAAAEKAADRIIENVTGASVAPAPAEPPQSFAPGARAPSMLAMALDAVLSTVVPAAHAQAAPNIDIDTPQSNAIQASMKARFEQLRPYFASGAVGFTNNGLIELRDASAVPLAERATAKRLVAEDNQDRNELYAEIARANNHPEWENDIRKTFARRWIERGAQPGWYYQAADGSWAQK